jgi:hypothetical protein
MEPSAPDQYQTLALPAETPAESVRAPDAVVPEVRAEARPVARDGRVASTSDAPDAPAPEIAVEARESRPAPAAARALPKRAMVAAGIVVGALALGGGAYMLAFDKPRRAAIQIGPVADMPAIRDGIVAVKAAAPAPLAPPAPRGSASLLSPVSSAPPLEMRSAEPAQPAPAAPAAPRASANLLSPVSSAPLEMRGAEPTQPAPATLAPPPALPVEPPPPARPVVETASITPAPGVPLPPPRPLVERAELRSDRPAVQPRRQAARPAPPVQTVAEAAAEQAPPERTKLLGVPLPDLAQTGRDIKDGVASFGETVLNLPKRF